jgi:hypothetical protein
VSIGNRGMRSDVICIRQGAGVFMRNGPDREHRFCSGGRLIHPQSSQRGLQRNSCRKSSIEAALKTLYGGSQQSAGGSIIHYHHRMFCSPRHVNRTDCRRYARGRPCMSMAAQTRSNGASGCIELEWAGAQENCATLGRRLLAAFSMFSQVSIAFTMKPRSARTAAISPVPVPTSRAVTQVGF